MLQGPAAGLWDFNGNSCKLPTCKAIKHDLQQQGKSKMWLKGADKQTLDFVVFGIFSKDEEKIAEFISSF